MMKLHYTTHCKEVDILEIIYRIFECRGYEDIKELLSPNWESTLVGIIDDAIMYQLDMNGCILLEDIFCIDDLTKIRKEVIDRLEYVSK